MRAADPVTLSRPSLPPLRWMGLLVGLFLATAATAQTLYWDMNGNTTGAGATPTGTWNTTNTNWTTNAAGTAATVVFVSGRDVVFSAGTNAVNPFTVTVTGTQNVSSLTVQEGAPTFTGGTINFNDATPDFTVATGLTTTVNSLVAGANGLTKLGAGQLTLNGANTYTGGTTLSAGSLALGSNTALSTGTLTIDGGTLLATGGTRTIANNIAVSGDFTIGGTTALTVNGTIDLGGATRTITVDNTAVTTFAGAVTEPYYSGLTKAGSGELVLAGNNTFSAPVTVSAGTLTLAHNNALGATGTYGNVVSSGATLALQNNISVNEDGLAISGTGAGGNGAIRNVSGTNTLAATINLSGDSTITATAGTLAFTGDLNLSANLTTAGAGNLTFSGGGYGGGSLTQNGNGSGGGTLTFAGSAGTSLSGVLNVNDGTVVLAKSGGANAVSSSALNVGNGTGAASSAVLRLGASNQIADHAGTLTVNGDGLFDVNNHVEKINLLAGTGKIDLGATGQLTIGVNSGSSTFGGTIAGAGTFIKEGSGSLTLAATLAITGELQIDNGTVFLSGHTLTAGTLHITGNSTIDFAGGNSTLSVTNFIIDGGVTLTVANWANAADYFFAQNWSGATFELKGTAPMNQIVFSGYNANDTKWQGYDHQVTPVPEPATYGAILLGILTAAFAWRRRRCV